MLSDWNELFSEIKTHEYAQRLKVFLDEEYANHVCYPPRSMMFNAFALTKPSEVKVVILGQDPYHNVGQAMGLSFSVPKGIDLPPSLINIYKEIESDLGITMDFSSGDLTYLAKQGVLLLNSSLSVREHLPGSHACKEYEEFFGDVIAFLERQNQPIVYMLWGNSAKRHASKVTNPSHYVLSSAHPSPMSANRGGWFNQHLFSQCDKLLKNAGVSPIDWCNKEPKL